MNTLTITLKDGKRKNKNLAVEMDLAGFERLAANFGLFSADFLKSIESAEKDHKKGRIKKIKSLKDLR